MSLATVIRAEFAYPGVGVLAGDSLQYLSIATAHGVIMVFFMIMPALFGAFGNFLLPTQLGVHDVAFPRLNSAAFWFLPGGLVMLLQLVCVDRRYQRMNAFNIRELQASLKRSYFTDLLNVKDQREVLNSSMLGLRYKLNNNATSEYDTHLFHGCGPTVAPKLRGSTLPLHKPTANPLYFPEYKMNLSLPSTLFTNISLSNQLFLGQWSSNEVQNHNLSSSFGASVDFTMSPWYNMSYRLHMLTTPLLPAGSSSDTILLGDTAYDIKYSGRALSEETLAVQFGSERLGRTGITELSLSSGSEDGLGSRYTRFTDPSIDYAYRSGNYFGK